MSDTVDIVEAIDIFLEDATIPRYKARLCVGFEIKGLPCYVMEKHGIILSPPLFYDGLTGYDVVGELRKIVMRSYAEIRQRNIHTSTLHTCEFGVGVVDEDGKPDEAGAVEIGTLTLHITDVFAMPGGRLPPEKAHLRPFKVSDAGRW